MRTLKSLHLRIGHQNLALQILLVALVIADEEDTFELLQIQGQVAPLAILHPQYTANESAAVREVALEPFAMPRSRNDFRLAGKKGFEIRRHHLSSNFGGFGHPQFNAKTGGVQPAPA